MLTLHSLVGLLYRPVVASHLPRASGSPRSAPERSIRTPEPVLGGSLRPYNHTHKNPDSIDCTAVVWLCVYVSECTMSNNLTRPNTVSRS